MVESMQQRSNTTGCLSRRQSAVGRDNGQHFGLTVAQKHTQRPQIVRSPVGIDDDVEARLAGMSRNRCNAEKKPSKGREQHSSHF